MPRLKVVTQKITKLHSEVLVLGFFQNVRPLRGLAAEVDWIYNGMISRLILKNKIKGVLGEATLLATERKLYTQKVLVMGLGIGGGYTERTAQDVYSRVRNALIELQIKDCAIELFGLSDGCLNGDQAIQAMLHGLYMDPAPAIETLILAQDEEKAQRIQELIYQLVGNT